MLEMRRCVRALRYFNNAFIEDSFALSPPKRWGCSFQCNDKIKI